MTLEELFNEIYAEGYKNKSAVARLVFFGDGSGYLIWLDATGQNIVTELNFNSSKELEIGIRRMHVAI